MTSTTTPLSTSLAPQNGAATSAIVTKLVFGVSEDQAWKTIMFYEQIDRPPPLHLRLLLPVPIRTEGRKSEVGDEALCIYKSGTLIKRVTHVEPGRRYAFEIAEQKLGVGGGMRLSGGDYTLRALGDGRTEVEVSTRYSSPRRPRWFWGPIEEAVCHSFHRHILRAMRRTALSKGAGEDRDG
jgi:hypothetical protein